MEAPSACTSFSLTCNFKAGQWSRSRQLCVAPTPTRRCCHRAATNQGAADTSLSIRKPLPQFQNEEEEESFQLDKEAVASTSKFVSPLEINLDLALYRAKSLARKGLCEDAREILSKCIRDWPDDGRPYMTLGRILMKQAKYVEARAVFENGCQATQGENAFIWQGWAVLERKMGNIKKARKLFDAAIAANKKHVAAWHGWACLEISEGNLNKGRDLLQKGIRYCGPNEYIFQTLALLEVKAKRYEKAQSLFLQATKCNPKSCASWLAWAQLEAVQENYLFARCLFEKAIQASPKNRFAWHIWALFEANQGEYDKARKIFRVGHALNPRDPVILQSLALFEYKCSSPTIAREIFKQAGQVDPRHQPIWIAWGILEEREGNIATARRLFKSSLNVDSQNVATWMSWATMEENQGNSVRAEEIRNLYFQQRTEVVGDASWDVDLSGFLAPAINRIKGFLTFDKGNEKPESSSFQQDEGDGFNNPDVINTSKRFLDNTKGGASFDLDSFLREKLSLDASRVYSGSEPYFLKKNKNNLKRNKNKSVWKPSKTKNTGTSSVT
ncbi:protein high chlorophyll fluorescent 107 isoform X2 [Cryptomeria japonica]|uniref:protein high chlorophyll fluorescent 107 isoform X2 n=1 Tax=Cryptomeria japonica TaxID=3369 RepID=UPI0027DA6BB1|nr:protein high chlorophyll fluorescent 107 isoform X2 [Cryptomeria japonica]